MRRMTMAERIEDKFTLIDNPNGEEGQVWFEHDETLAYPLRRVWTVVEGDSGKWWAEAGYHIVNRVYYLISEEEWTDEDLAVDYLWEDFKEEETDGQP
jgi:hypothetical protein